MHHQFGSRYNGDRIEFREWAPNATGISLVGDLTGWGRSERYRFVRDGDESWSLSIPRTELPHGSLYRLRMEWAGGEGERIPAFARRVVQDEATKIFSAQAWDPPQSYQWKRKDWRRKGDAPLIYEAHVGMAQEEARVGTYREFADKIIPRIAKAGYNTIQLMAVQEHPYYGSFGYQVSSFFAPSSRFGTPEELKCLVDVAHEHDLAVIMDLVHSHAVKNEVEGLSRYDGTSWQFFHDGPRGSHIAWDTRCFDYGKPSVVQFLLSNCRYWLEEFSFDGFRFDGVTSMLYLDHGLGKNFTSYNDYFSPNTDLDAVSYLSLANQLIHELRPDAITVAEDVSGMPGLAAGQEKRGLGFDFRLAMGTPDYWIKTIKEQDDHHWSVTGIWWELTNRRQDERTISYAESHDQALVGDKTIIFRLADAAMYHEMRCSDRSLVIDRAVALHKMIRLVTLATAQSGYLNFMGNEFGHPEWIDFPREGNGWSCHYARRQWSLVDDPKLRYSQLGAFDQAMIDLVRSRHTLTGSPRLLHEHGGDQVLAFEREGLLFVFNFSPTRSYVDYGIQASPGKYTPLLSTDEHRFGGYGLVALDAEHFTTPRGAGGEQVRVYLPARTAVVYQNNDALARLA
jgi:1,4-alpha-glucan branching enzyme